MRVIQAGNRARLALEALDGLRISAGLVGQELDRDLAAEASIFSLVHHPHAAGADARQHLVVRDHGADHRHPAPVRSSTSGILPSRPAELARIVPFQVYSSLTAFKFRRELTYALSTFGDRSPV